MKILVFGASIAWGAFDAEVGGWVERLKTYFLSDYENTWVWVYNFSISGNSSRDILQYIEHDISKIMPIEKEELVIVFAVWINDSGYVWKSPNIPLSEFSKNFSNLLDISKKYAMQTFVLWLFPVDEDALNASQRLLLSYQNKNVSVYHDTLKKISREKDVEFIDLWNVIWLENLTDGLHPDSVWHKKIYEIVKDKLLEKI